MCISFFFFFTGTLASDNLIASMVTLLPFFFQWEYQTLLGKKCMWHTKMQFDMSRYLKVATSHKGILDIYRLATHLCPTNTITIKKFFPKMPLWKVSYIYNCKHCFIKYKTKSRQFPFEWLWIKIASSTYILHMIIGKKFHRPAFGTYFLNLVSLSLPINSW